MNAYKSIITVTIVISLQVFFLLNKNWRYAHLHNGTKVSHIIPLCLHQLQQNITEHNTENTRHTHIQTHSIESAALFQNYCAVYFSIYFFIF